jgi:hypothetical protein
VEAIFVVFEVICGYFAIYRTTANHISIGRCDDFCFKVDPQA